MEPRAHHVLIGLFTVVIAAAALLFSMWLGRSYRDADLQYYTVVFSEAVRGLSQGSAVQYSGIKIGDVTNLSLDPKDPRVVRARIRIQATIPVTADTKARLVLADITGNSIIELSGGTPESPPLDANGEGIPVIYATPSPISQLLANSDELMANVTELVRNAKNMLSAENAERLASTLKSLENVADSMANQEDNVATLLEALTSAGEAANVAIRDASSLLTNADALVQEQGTQTLDSAQRAMASLEKTAVGIDRILAENRGAISSGMQGLTEIGPTLQELRATLSDMRRITRRLEDNPAKYLLGREQIQEFEP